MPTIEAEDPAGPADGAGFAPIETERLRLRPFRAGDADTVRRLAGEWEVARSLANVPYPYGPDDAAEWIGHARRGLAAGSEVNLAITRRDDGALVGAVGLTLSLHGRSAELGYWIGQPYWGQGFATEAAAALLHHGFLRLGLSRVIATTLGHNKASVRVLEKIGLRYERDDRREFRSRGGVRPVAVYAVTRDRIVEGQMRADAPAAEAPGADLETVPVVLVAAAVLLDADDRVLLSQRPPGKPMAGLWEFPGGKVGDGEAPEAALIRELQEELGIDTSASCLAPFSFASHRYDDFHLLMPLFVCRVWDGTATPREGQRLAWVRPQRLGDYPMPPADASLVAMLRDLL